MTREHEPTRLKDVNAWPGESALGPELMNAAIEMDSFGSAEMALLRRKLLARRATRPSRTKLIVALAALAIFISGGVVGAALTRIGTHVTPVASPVPVAPSRLTPKSPVHHPKNSETTPSFPDTAPPDPAPARRVLALRSPPSISPVQEPRVQPQVQSKVTKQADEPNGELSSILNIFAELKQPGRAAIALDLIRAHEASYPNQNFFQELQAARVQAYFASGQHDLALKSLASVAEADLRIEQRLLRAELLAETKRCLEARGDFSHVFESTATNELRARALYGRALCWAREGNDAQKQRDLYEYIFRFPKGAKATQARRALGLNEVRP